MLILKKNVIELIKINYENIFCIGRIVKKNNQPLCNQPFAEKR